MKLLWVTNNPIVVKEPETNMFIRLTADGDSEIDIESDSVQTLLDINKINIDLIKIYIFNEITKILTNLINFSLNQGENLDEILKKPDILSFNLMQALNDEFLNNYDIQMKSIHIRHLSVKEEDSLIFINKNHLGFCN